MKVCFVIPTLTSGGAERVAVTVLSALDGKKHERVLYLFSDRNAVYRDRLDPGVRVVVASATGWVRRWLELRRFIRDTRPDVVMAFLSYFITALAAWMSGAGPAVVFNQQTPTTAFLEDPDFAWRRPWRRRVFALVTRVFYGRADAVVVTSQGLADDLAGRYGVPRERMHVLHNPVDLEAIAAAVAAPIDGDVPRPLIVAAGRLAGVKNYPLLLEALARLDGVHAWILGEGPDRASLERLAVEKGVEGRVRFWGFQANPWRFMARADVFVLTSTYEGFGNVLIEAMASGAPVVATRSPGTVEILGDGASGLLVEHDPSSVATAIASLLGDEPQRARLRKTGGAHVRQYATPRVAARYEELFEALAT